MTSPLLDLSYQSCPYPLPLDHVVFVELAAVSSVEQWVELVAIYFGSHPGTAIEKMMDWAYVNRIVFDCPVCGNTGKRQVWIELNESSRTLCSVPCYCQNAAPAPCDCTDGLKI